MNRTLNNAITLFVAPFFAAVSLAATPIKVEVEQVQAGLEVAIAQQIIPKHSALQIGVSQFIGLLKSGFTPEDASFSTGVSLAVIERLEHLGVGHTHVAVRQQPKRVAVVVAVSSPGVAAAKELMPPAVPLTEAPKVATVQPVPPVNVAQNPPAVSVPQPAAVAIAPAQIQPQPSVVQPVAQPAVQATQPVPPVVAAPKVATAQKPYEIANVLVRGLTIANRSSEIGYHANLSARVQSVIRLLRRGVGLEQAATIWNVPEKTINRLLRLGNNQF